MFKRLDPRAWPSRLVVRYLIAIFIFTFAIANYALWKDSKVWDVRNIPGPQLLHNKHPIIKLMKDARAQHDELLSKRSYDIYAAAARYRSRRGRHPPPGFDRWVQAALASDSIIVEEFFDRIYKDLTPFWAIDTDTVRRRAHSWPWVVRVRTGEARGDGDVEGRVPWLQLWTDLVKEFAEHLPDVDMPINYMDEPRLLVPYDEIAKLVQTAQETREMPKPDNVTSEFLGLATLDAAKPKPYDPKWSGPSSKYWDLAVKTCGEKTPAHGVKAVTKFSESAEFPKDWAPDYAYMGFVKNWTSAMDPCLQPHLRQLHGSFIEPISLSSTDELIPLFGGSKLPMNNEILIPGAMYLSDMEFYSGGNSHGPPWPEKKNGLIWRGDGSGGRTKEGTWHHFQRHRLVDMFNTTTVTRAETEGGRARTFELPSETVYESPRTAQKELGTWVNEFADVGFVHLCPPGECDWLHKFYKEVEQVPMKEQYRYKFLPDADGNSFSARFRGFLRSTSVPLKATIYAEWHDDRLTPWVHFIPLDNTFQDLFPVLEFFADGNGDGDYAARVIAESGKAWSEQVLRRDDMKLYVWRLLLEWARVCDKNRSTLGYVKDII
jgi:hypothetical protein